MNAVNRFPWGDFPDVIRNGDIGELKLQPEYIAAKSGDIDAAYTMASHLLRKEFLDSVESLARLHSRPKILPVNAMERSGNNKIPLAFSFLIAKELSIGLETDILQASKAWKTNSGADHRLVSRVSFSGSVDKNVGYILLDDTLTMGGTLADLRGYIMSNNGSVVGASVAVAHAGALRLPIHNSMIESIYRKHGKENVDQFTYEWFGYGIECFTQGEAGHIRAAPSLDAIRARLVAAQRRLGDLLHGGSLAEGARQDNACRDNGGESELTELFSRQKGTYHVTVLSAEKGDVLLRHAGRNKILSLSPEESAHCDFASHVGQPITLHFNAHGEIAIVARSRCRQGVEQ